MRFTGRSGIGLHNMRCHGIKLQEDFWGMREIIAAAKAKRLASKKGFSQPGPFRFHLLTETV
jgi:hypothetical protein